MTVVQSHTASPPVRSRLFSFSIFVVVAIATGWRLIGVTEWPIKFFEAVQYESAITTRSIWLRIVPRPLTEVESAWSRDGHMRLTSPPILQSLVAMSYVVAGSEEPWLVGVWNTLFWVSAGWFVYRTATTLANDRLAGMIALSWCLLAPGGIVISRSFQPESLLSLGTAAAVYVLTRPQAGSARRDTLLCITVCAAAAFIKPGILFFPLFAGFAARVLARGGPLRTTAGHWVLFVAAVSLPGFVYTYIVFGTSVAGRFMPALLVETDFLGNVAGKIANMVGAVPVLLGIAGALRLAVRRNFVPLGLLLGYVAYIPVFTWHTSIGHAYYHAHLIPLIAVCLGPPVAAVLRRIRLHPTAGYSAAALLVAFHLLFTFYPFTGPWRWVPGPREAVASRWEELRAETETDREVGSIVGPGASCLCMSNALGLPLEYHAWVRTEWWPRWEEMDYLRYMHRTPKFDSVKHMDQLIEKHDPRFFVVTDFVEFDTHAYLAVLLRHYFPKLIASNDRFRIYSR